MNNDVYIQELKEKLEKIQSEIAELKNIVKETLQEINDKEKIVENIIELITYEGVSIDEDDVQSMMKSIPDIAFDILSKQKDKQPMHYSDIYDETIKLGVLVPGKNPSANLLTQITRDERFVRVSPGTYGLINWGLTPMKKKNRRKKRKKPN